MWGGAARIQVPRNSKCAAISFLRFLLGSSRLHLHGLVVVITIRMTGVARFWRVMPLVIHTLDLRFQHSTWRILVCAISARNQHRAVREQYRIHMEAPIRGGMVPVLLARCASMHDYQF